MELVHSLAENFQTPVNKLNDLNLDYIKIPETHLGSHKMSSRATCGPREVCLGLRVHVLIA